MLEDGNEMMQEGWERDGMQEGKVAGGWNMG